MNNISALAFDLDGTVYQGNRAVVGAKAAIAALARAGYRIFYFTNNSAKSREQIVEKLNRLGFPAGPQNTYCTSGAVLAYLLEKKIKTVCLIGTDNLKNELLSSGIKIKDSPHRVAAVVVGLDPSFDYGKITKALAAINRGAKLIVANCDPSYPVENNRRLPGCGAMVGAVVSAANHAPDFIAGKPNTYILRLLCREHGLAPGKICIVGDSPESDIKMADNFKCRSILFDPENVFPDFRGTKVKRLREIIHLLNRKERAGE